MKYSLASKLKVKKVRDTKEKKKRHDKEESFT